MYGQADEEILDTYEQERRPHVTRTIRAAVTVGWALTGGQDRAAIIRRIALAGLCRVPGFSTAVVDSASPRLTGSALLDRRRFSPRDPAGRLCPQPAITIGHDEARLDALLGDGWAPLTDGPPAASDTSRPDAAVVPPVLLPRRCPAVTKTNNRSLCAVLANPSP